MRFYFIVVLICIPPMNEIERVHVFSLVIWKSSFVKCLFKFLAHFQFGYLFSLFYRNFLYIRDTTLCQ